MTACAWQVGEGSDKKTPLESSNKFACLKNMACYNGEQSCKYFYSFFK